MAEVDPSSEIKLLQNLTLFVQNSENNAFKKHFNEWQSEFQRVNSLNEFNDAIQSSSVVAEFFRSLQYDDVNSESSVCLSAAKWLRQIIKQQLMPTLMEPQLHVIMKSLHNMMNSTNVPTVTHALFATGFLMKMYSPHAEYYFEKAFHPIGSNMHSRLGENNKELNFATVQCLNMGLSCFLGKNLTILQYSICELYGNFVLELLYNTNKPISNSFLLCCLLFLNRVVGLCVEYTKRRISELLGIGKSYMHYNGNETVKPQRVHASQQSIYDSAEEQIESADGYTRSPAGKSTKTRKARAATKRQKQPETSNQQLTDTVDVVDVDIKMSDSEPSDTEPSGSRAAQDRQTISKVRLAAITLVGDVTRTQERRITYGYWHALFPSELIKSNGVLRDDLLYVSQHDANARCRTAALQVATQLLNGSKQFLQQAEISDKRLPTSYTPFSMTLGHMVVAIYKSLTEMLTTETSLPTLIQTLKCLGALVQSTPFQHFGSGFVTHFVERLRPLVYHRDAAVQVSTLMVFEYLFASMEISQEIAELVGLPAQYIKKKPATTNKKDKNGEIFEMMETDEYVESDSDDEIIDEKPTTSVATMNFTRTRSTVGLNSWLLKRILQNLNIAEENRFRAPVSVRIESLQILSAMAIQFRLLSDYVPNVVEVLKLALNDPLTDVALNGARCFGCCAYQMSRQLLDKSIDIEDCEEFWKLMLPIVMEYLLNEEDILEQREMSQQSYTAFQVVICDAVANIGMIMFERLPHSQQMNLISLLSGLCSGDNGEVNLKAAAVRALAVFVLYPSMQSNLVFVENVAELTMRLQYENLLMRIKAAWSMGNVTDALVSNYITNSSSTRKERISDDLLLRLLISSTRASSDNDKISCNAVRSVGNLLRLLNEKHFGESKYVDAFECAIEALVDRLGAGGSAKVKWNACYAVGNLFQNSVLFTATPENKNECDWLQNLYTALSSVIVRESNFKVRINATAAILHINKRAHFGQHFKTFWESLLTAIEHSHKLNNFYEYNHRDQLQEQLCLGISHLLQLAQPDDFQLLKNQLVTRLEIVQNTWQRVYNRMVPEKVAPLLACSQLLKDQQTDELQRGVRTLEQNNSMAFIAQAFIVQ